MSAPVRLLSEDEQYAFEHVKRQRGGSSYDLSYDDVVRLLVIARWANEAQKALIECRSLCPECEGADIDCVDCEGLRALLAQVEAPHVE